MKKRVDIVLFELGLLPSREKARRAIMAGQVFLGSDCVAKSSLLIDEDDYSRLSIKQKDSAVSRAYYKLQKAFDVFSVSATGKVCIDVGASTGGFTQLLLERGAISVYAVDCGVNQLDYSLRRDERVAVMEKTNARYMTAGVFDPLPTLAVMDVSFISVKKILPVLAEELSINELVTLIKPQFEAGRLQVGKGGIVRDKEVHRTLLIDICTFAAEYGFVLRGLDYSPIKGAKGNIEYIAYFSRVVDIATALDIEKMVSQTVINATCMDG